MTPQPGFTPHIARLGNGPRSVLALHCTMAYSGAWNGFLRAAGEDLTLVAPDMPSHGKSADWDETSNFADTVYAGSLGALDAPMDLIGHSFGAVIALRLAVTRPDLVRSLTMIEPVFFHIARADAPDTVADHDTHAQPFNDALQQGDKEGAARAFNRMWSDSGPSWTSLPASLRAAMTRAIHVVPGTQPFLFDDTCNMVPEMGRANMPALVIRGATSLPVIQATNAGIARRLPNAVEAAVTGAGHMAPISHPAQTAKIWRDFIDSAGV